MKDEDTSLILARLMGTVNIQREALCILLNPPPTSEQVQVALTTQAQKLKDMGLGNAWNDEQLAEFCEGVDQTLHWLLGASFRESLRGMPNRPPSLAP